jgi:hypothetical protein
VQRSPVAKDARAQGLVERAVPLHVDGLVVLSELSLARTGRSGDLEAAPIALTVILFCVRVPVLSETMAVQEPRVSTASRWRITALFSAIRRTPIASATVTTIGRPAGMAATASATASVIICGQALPMRSPTPKARAQMTRIPQVIQIASCWMRR